MRLRRLLQLRISSTFADDRIKNLQLFFPFCHIIFEDWIFNAFALISKAFLIDKQVFLRSSEIIVPHIILMFLIAIYSLSSWLSAAIYNTSVVAITFRDADRILKIVILTQFDGFAHLRAVKGGWIIRRSVNGSVFTLVAWILMTILIVYMKIWEFAKHLLRRLSFIEWGSSFHHFSDFVRIYWNFKNFFFVWRIFATNRLLDYPKGLSSNQFLFQNHFLMKVFLNFMLFILRRISRFYFPDLT